MDVFIKCFCDWAAAKPCMVSKGNYVFLVLTQRLTQSAFTVLARMEQAAKADDMEHSLWTKTWSFLRVSHIFTDFNKLLMNLLEKTCQHIL